MGWRTKSYQEGSFGLFRFNICALKAALSDARLDKVVGLGEVKPRWKALAQFREENLAEVLFQDCTCMVEHCTDTIYTGAGKRSPGTNNIFSFNIQSDTLQNVYKYSMNG